MPDPLLYFQAMIAAAATSGLIVLAASRVRRPAGDGRIQVASILGFAAGVASSSWLLSLAPAWPPASGLDRLLAIVLPAAVVIELAASHKRVSPWGAWTLRIGLAAASGRVLLHGSVYLPGPHSQWTAWQAVAALSLCAVLFAGQWGMLSWLSARSPGASIPLAVAMAIQTAGVAVMLGGYITGGAAAIPPAAAAAGAAVAANCLLKMTDHRALLGAALASLFGIVMVGRFFGSVSTPAALTIFLAPLLCWTTEAPFLKKQNPWIVASARLFLTAIPLAIVLFAAKRHFDRDLAPLLTRLEVASSQSVQLTRADAPRGYRSDWPRLTCKPLDPAFRP
jgi:hypothetical protein